MEQFERIRRDERDEGLSIRALAARHQVHRRTVRQALRGAVPPPRKPPQRVAPVLGGLEATVRAWLEQDLGAPRKQRHTARRVWQRLIEEEGAQVAESSVRAMVRELKVEVGLGRTQVAVAQTHPAGAEAEVDFGEFVAVIAGAPVRLWMFVLRLSHSGRAVHVAYANQAQESFLDGHVAAFDALGGVPTGMIRYDNLKPAVIRVLLGRDRWENERFIGLRSHYGFASFFCLPGIGGAHEKGGVEGEIGRFRRRHLTPVPQVGSLAALNEELTAADARDDSRRIGARAETVGAAAGRERPALRALPAGRFDVSQTLTCRVDAKARICVRQSYYSVPAGLAGRRVEARLGARTVAVRADGRVVAEHPRSLHKGSEDLVLDHYLEVLTRKPGALPGATALVAARASGVFTDTHQRFWDAARAAARTRPTPPAAAGPLNADAAGTRALVGVLLLHRSMPADAVQAGMLAALTLDRYDPDLVAVEARRYQDSRPRALTLAPTPAAAAGPPTTAATTAAAAGAAGAAGAAPPSGLPTIHPRPAPTLDAYDDLLPNTGATA